MRNAVWAMLIGIFWLTPFVWSLKPDAIQWIPLCFRMFIVPQPLSPFPIFPWAGYYFAGYLATEYFLSAKNPKKAARYMLVAVLVIVVGVYLSSQSVWTYYPDGMNWWLVSPAHMFMRISGALTLFAGLYLLQQRMTGRISAFLSLEGKESLVVYVGQGIILYGETLNRKLHVYLPKPVTPLTILLLTLSVIAIMGIYSAYWHKYKQSMPRHAQWSLYLASSVTVLLFLFS